MDIVASQVFPDAEGGYRTRAEWVSSTKRRAKRLLTRLRDHDAHRGLKGGDCRGLRNQNDESVSLYRRL